MASFKIQGWEIRLNDFFEKMKNKPFKRGLNDCALFAGFCIEIMTGLDFTSEFVGKYKTLEQSQEILKDLGYNDLSGVADKKLRALPSVKHAQRGDCILLEIAGHQALSIVDLSGTRAVTVGLDGLIFIDRKHWLKAWAV